MKGGGGGGVWLYTTCSCGNLEEKVHFWERREREKKERVNFFIVFMLEWKRIIEEKNVPWNRWLFKCTIRNSRGSLCSPIYTFLCTNRANISSIGWFRYLTVKAPPPKKKKMFSVLLFGKNRKEALFFPSKWPLGTFSPEKSGYFSKWPPTFKKKKNKKKIRNRSKKKKKIKKKKIKKKSK